ncbi:MAG: RNA polymerase subunit sigma-70 [Firmicutes bacterium HGW-Firmicutes-15]|nr:MAG: RNA polymerase subunit sigma-70 [Firmicutes bacterium HGW-Firmicutes-15]
MKDISQDQAEAIFVEHSSYVYRIALFLSKSPTLAEDITQDTFLQVFRKYNSYDPAKPITPWIYQIALNITRKTMRKQKWLHLVKEVPTNEGLNYVEDKILQDELGHELWKEINKLTLKSREVIVLHYYSGLKLNEIATALDIPLGTCKSRLNTALNSLEKQLQGNKITIACKGEDLYGTI